MQVYKTCLKIIKENRKASLIYIVVFMVFVAMSSISTNTFSSSFATIKVNVAIINYDNDSDFLKGFKSYIKSNENIVNIKQDKNSQQDAVFYGNVDYIITIPKGFTEDLINGKSVQVGKSTPPKITGSTINVDQLINNYMNTARVYLDSNPSLSQSELAVKINSDLSNKAKVNMSNAQAPNISMDKAESYYNFLGYSMMMILIFVVFSALFSFNNIDIKRRNISSPITFRSINLQIFLAILTIGTGLWVLSNILSFALYGDIIKSKIGLLFIVNSFAYMIVSLSISFLMVNVIRSKTAIMAASNMFSLGACFLSGVFVPQIFMAKSTLFIGQFLPQFWYVKANSQITKISVFSLETLSPIYINILIEIAFAVAIFAITLVYLKQKKQVV